MRRTDREITDRKDILDIIDRAKILHLGLWDGEYPYVVPMHFGHEDGQEGPVFYMHSAAEGYKLEVIKRCPNVCVEMECGVELISGGDEACRYGAAYASVIGRGKASLVTDTNEKMKALALLMRNQTGRDFEISPAMAESVAVIKVEIKELTAKARPLPGGERA